MVKSRVRSAKGVMLMSEKKFVFEEALKRLEEINRLLSQGNAMLDEGISLYEEGAKFAAQCKEALENANARIQKAETDR